MKATRRIFSRLGRPLVVGALLTTMTPSSAETSAGSSTEASADYAIPHEKYTLENGLEVILHRDPSLPLVAVNVWYHVGPANEPPDRSGFAHLFEHLMFEGSRHVGREFDRLLESVGATTVNGTTSWDRTNYFETVPSEHLELVLWLESDRMGFMLDTLDRERLDVQRDVVKNERRQRYENAPYGPSDLATYDILFPKGHPYHGAVIGSMQDLSRADREDVESFFKRFYAPSNATLAVAGDIDVALTKEWIRRYFATLPSGPKPARKSGKTVPLRREERAHIQENVQLARMQMAWITPAAYSEADVALEVAARVLAGGKASRLYRKLVVDERLSPEVSAILDSNEVASIFAIEATAATGSKTEDIEKSVDAVMALLASEGPTNEELERAKTSLFLDVRLSLQLLNGGGGETGRAGILQRLNHYLGDPGALPEQMVRIATVSKDDIRTAISNHLSPDRRAVVMTVPVRQSSRGASP